MKKIFLILAFTILFTVSCTKSEWTVSDYSPVDKVAPLSETAPLLETIVYTPEDNPIDDYFDYYIGDASLLEGIEEYAYFTSSGTTVAEAGVFKVKDEATADALLEAFSVRCENLAAIYENYSPEDTARAQNMQKGSFDDIVWFVATSDNDAVISVIK